MTSNEQTDNALVVAQRAETQRRQADLQQGIVLGGGVRYSLAELMEVARIMATAGLVPDALKGKPADVLIIVMKGADLGLSPSQSVDAIHAIKGKTQVGVHLAVSLTRKAGHRVHTVDESATSCTVRVTRNDDPTPFEVTFTTEDAKRAQIKNEKYQTDPQSMLYARAATRCIRRACPEVLLGLFVEGEIDTAEPARPTLAQVAAERTDRRVAAPEIVEPDPAEPEVDEAASMAAELAAIEAEHQAEYGDGQPAALDFGHGDDR